MAEKGLSQSEVARDLNLERQQIYRVMRRKRKLTVEEVMTLSQKYNIEPPFSPSAGRQIIYARVVGEVAAGVWRDMVHEAFDDYEVPYPVDPRWPEGSIKAYLIKGESINRTAQDGHIAVALDFSAAPRDIRHDDWVIAERKRGDLREVTVKRVKFSDGELLLCPDSTDDRFQPLTLGKDGEDSVRVVAFVLDFLKPATRF